MGQSCKKQRELWCKLRGIWYNNCVFPELDSCMLHGTGCPHIQSRFVTGRAQPSVTSFLVLDVDLELLSSLLIILSGLKQPWTSNDRQTMILKRWSHGEDKRHYLHKSRSLGKSPSCLGSQNYSSYHLDSYELRFAVETEGNLPPLQEIRQDPNPTRRQLPWETAPHFADPMEGFPAH